MVHRVSGVSLVATSKRCEEEDGPMKNLMCCGIFAAGTEDKTPSQYIESAIRKIAEVCR